MIKHARLRDWSIETVQSSCKTTWSHTTWQRCYRNWT